MRIALVSQEYPPATTHGGIGTQTRAKALGLARLGHDVVVLSHSTDEGRHEDRDGHVRVVRIPGYDHLMPLQTVEAWWLTYGMAVAVALTSLHRESPLDLIDFPEYGAEGFTWLLNRGGTDRIPTVIHLHGPLTMLAHTIGWPEMDSEFYRTGTFMEGTCLRLADAVFSSSACSADWCARAYDLDRETIDIIHTGVDTKHFSPRPEPKPSRPTIVFVGRVTASKGVDVLVDAAVRLADEIPGLQVRLIGRAEPDVIASLRDRAAVRRRDDLLEIVGFVAREHLPDHLSRAHVFAAPSTYEGGPGFVYLEAMACGLPVVATSGSGAEEIIVHGRNGMLVPPRDVDALVDALRALLRDETERATMGELARQFVKDHADSEGCIRRLETYYVNVVGRAMAPTAAPRPSAVV